MVLWDFGAKGSIQRRLEDRGCHVTCVPADTTAAEILALKPDGVMLSNGPGDPADNTSIIEQLSSAGIAENSHLWHLPGPSAAGAVPGGKNPQAEVWPPGREPTRQGSDNRTELYDQPESRLMPWTRRRCLPMPPCALSTGTMAPAKGWITRTCPLSPYSSTRKPAAVPLDTLLLV